MAKRGHLAVDDSSGEASGLMDLASELISASPSVHELRLSGGCSDFGFGDHALAVRGPDGYDEDLCHGSRTLRAARGFGRIEVG